MNLSIGKRGVDKVLVIDDDRGPRESLRMLLKMDFEVHCADHVQAGLDIFHRERPDVVVMDIRMPGLNGIEGLREIRRLDPHVAVIMLTGFGTLETAQEALRLGANDYLKKPFDADELLDTIRRNVARAQLNRRRARAEEELQALNRKLTEEIAGRDEMARMGMASAALVHDLRNPLSAVLGYFSLMADQLKECREKSGFQVPPLNDLSEYLDVIERNLMRCRELTEVWHELGRSDLSNALRVDIGQMLREIVEEVRADPLAKGREVRLAETPAPATIIADVAQMKRALDNILRNALQAVPSGTGWVEVSCRRDPAGGVAIVIRDNGCGLSPDVIAHLAEPFFTTRRLQGGSGLGLFIANQVAQKHGGRLEIENRPAGGAEVRFILPAAPPTKDPAPA